MKHQGYAFVDVETLGLDPGKYDMIEIALLLTDAKLQFQSEHQFYILPTNDRVFQEKALAMTGYTSKLWARRGAVPLGTALQEVLKLTKSRGLAGHNVPFDEAHITEGCRLCWRTDPEPNLPTRTAAWKPQWHHRRLDTTSLLHPLMAYRDRDGEMPLPGSALRELCDALNISWYPGAYKSALEDVRRTYLCAVELHKVYTVGIETYLSTPAAERPKL